MKWKGRRRNTCKAMPVLSQCRCTVMMQDWARNPKSAQWIASLSHSISIFVFLGYKTPARKDSMCGITPMKFLERKFSCPHRSVVQDFSPCHAKPSWTPCKIPALSYTSAVPRDWQVTHGNQLTCTFFQKWVTKINMQTLQELQQRATN